MRVSDRYAPTVSCPGDENSLTHAGLKGGFAGGVTLKVGRLKDSCAFLKSIPLRDKRLDKVQIVI